MFEIVKGCQLSWRVRDVVRRELDKIKDAPFFHDWRQTSMTGVLLRMRYYAKDGKNFADKRVYFAFCGNVHVFYAEVSRLNLPFSKVKAWENTSNHDTCWTSDGLHNISRDYFELCHKVNLAKAPIRIKTGVQFRPIEDVIPVVMTLQVAKDNSYRYELVRIVNKGAL